MANKKKTIHKARKIIGLIILCLLIFISWYFLFAHAFFEEEIGELHGDSVPEAFLAIK